MPKANNARALWPLLVIVVATLAAGGCSTSTTTSGLSLVDEQGGHPANFLSTHPGFAVSSVSQCTLCHGDDLKGGIANASCFTAACHHGTKTGWVVFPPGPSTPQGHGTSAKKKPGSSGFVSCRICHGNDFLGGSVQVACLSAGCHGGAGQSPHPAQWRTGDDYVHMTTDEGNASVCALCHLNGANSPIGPPPAPPAGTPPGCFNNTLCHGENPVPHPLDNTWVATPPSAQPHGNSAKSVPGASSGFAYCQICHGTGTNFAGGSSGVSCLNTVGCHGAGVQSPHPSQWFQGDSYEHITTASGNAPACALCHYNEPNAGNHPPPPTPPPAGSGCFNGTLCHGASVSIHPAGWFIRPPDVQPHGQSAKADPSGGGQGFAFCQICHGNDFLGGIAQFSCQIVACHGGGGLSPHAAQWRPGNTYEHNIDMNEGNAPVCGLCHLGGGSFVITSPRTEPVPPGVGCFNNTLCHGD